MRSCRVALTMAEMPSNPNSPSNTRLISRITPRWLPGLAIAQRYRQLILLRPDP
ncbi:hypothetical protein D9M71_302930 [compost metagenome]